jgi:outer membrane protein OmpA-like peptidoglycan-associated protein
MKRGYSVILAATTAILLVTTGQPSFADGAPTTDEIVRALRPVPSALQGGHQGLPTIGAAPVRPEVNPNYTNASTTGTVVHTEIKAGRTATAPRAQAKAASAVVAPAGCPQQSDSTGQPMIDFKVAFEFGSAQLKPESVETLSRLGKALNEGLSDQKLFKIEGHTDAVGTLSYNARLSQQRAAAVREFLVRQMGVSAERLASVGKAFCEPLDPKDPYGSENRRVVVVNKTS